jgi:hypothetical protein
MIHLPENPGLARRLAYGNYIRSRTFNRRQGTFNIIRRQGTFNIIRRQGTFTNDVDIYTYNVENIEVDNQYDNSIGLCLNKLIKNTTVEIITKPLFCPICQNVKTTNCVSRNLSCGHTFHIECIEYWLKDNTNCPICRYDFNEK